MVEEGNSRRRAEEEKPAVLLSRQMAPCNVLPSNPPVKTFLDAKYSSGGVRRTWAPHRRRRRRIRGD
jgi:hypothetical protein